MSDIQLFLLEYEKSKKEAGQIAIQSAEKLEKKHLKLLELIESLGDYINSDESKTRNRTLIYLAEVLEALPPKVLTGHQRNLLCEFILSRIHDDSEGIGPCARGLLALEERGQWDASRAAGVLTTLLENTHPLRQYRLQSDRYAVVQLIDRLLAKNREAMKELHHASPDFLSRFITYFDGEKDPRNLMIVFSILKVPMSEWDAGTDTQDLFDSVFNYFPITFRPPPDDPYGITAQDLKDRLRACISSTSAFAPHAFPALLDRLDSTSINTKRDCLQALHSCITEYSSSTISNYAVTLWDALKFEILSVQEEDLAQEALACFSAIASKLSQDSPNQLNIFMGPVVKECNEHLEDAPTKQSEAAGRILGSIASASVLAVNTIILRVVPQVLALYNAADNVSKRRGLLEVLSRLVSANVDVFGQWRTIVPTANDSIPVADQTNTLEEFSEQIHLLLVNGLIAAPINEVSYRLAMLKVLLALAKVRSLLKDEQITAIIEALSNIVISEKSYGKDETKSAAISGLLDVAHQKPQLVIGNAFPSFLAHLPDADDTNSLGYVPILEAFAKLAGEQAVFQTVILRLKNKISAAVHQQASGRYLRALFTAMLFAFTVRKSGMTSDLAQTFCSDLVIPLIQQCTASNKDETPLRDEVVLDLLGRVSNIIIRTLPSDRQTSIAAQTYTLYRNGTTDSVAPFTCNADITTARDSELLILSTHVLASLRKDVLLPADPDSLLTELLAFIQIPDLTPRVRAATLKQVSVIVNKFLTNAQLSQHVKAHLLAKQYSSLDIESWAVPRAFAIIKGLVLRNSSLLSTAFPFLLEALDSEVNGLKIARGFIMLLQPDDILTKENHCNISGLHKQKAFNMLIPQIAAQYRTASAIVKTHYLIATSGLLRYALYDIISNDLASLTPLLLQSLDLPPEEFEVKTSAIDNLSAILTHDPATVEEHANTLIGRLLSTVDHKRNTPAVREAALRCLTIVLGALKPEVLIPLRRQVTKRLTGALDDGKRAVRAQAVRCRRRWLQLGEDNDDEDEE